MKPFASLITFLTLTSIMLGSCSNKPSSESGSSQTSEISSQQSEDVSPFTVRDVYKTRYLEPLPSEGNVRLLVLPIEISGYSFPNGYQDVLNKAFNGNGRSETGYWESVSSYYEKSSFGKVHLSYEIANKYQTGKTAKEIAEGYSHPAVLGAEAVADYKRINGSDSTKKFDSDSSGFIDGVVFIYSAPFMRGQDVGFDASIYWAYTTYAFYYVDDFEPDVESPKTNCLCWASYHFITSMISKTSMDTHTLIHETGHMFGLDDYYCSSDSTFNPMGGCTMMDQAILDLDAYSKLILGWVDPYVVDGDCELVLKPSESTGQCILVPSSKWTGTAFDEYMLLELYSPSGLNYQDSHIQYEIRVPGYSKEGVQLYHVDSRLMRGKKTVTSFRSGWSYVKNPTLEELETETGYYYYIGATNCNKEAYPAQTDFSAVHMMEAGKKNTFKKGNYGVNSSLFHTGDKFSIFDYGKEFFPKGTTMNNSAVFEYQIEIVSVGDGEAKVRFELIA